MPAPTGLSGPSHDLYNPFSSGSCHQRLHWATTTQAPGAIREIDTGEVRTLRARLALHRTVKEFSDGKPHPSTRSAPNWSCGPTTTASTSSGRLLPPPRWRPLDGEIKDGNIACPFHDWRWGGDGKCKGIPYAKRVLLRAKTRAWTTMTQNGLTRVARPRGQLPPREEDAIPYLDEYDTV